MKEIKENKKMENKLEVMIENNIKSYLDSLVVFILEKNPNASRDRIYHKIKELQFYGVNKPIKHASILDSITAQISTIKVKKSKFKNYTCKMSDTTGYNFNDFNSKKFILDITTKTIIGTENLKGEVEQLTKPLIELCHKYKLKYELPLNLNLDNDQVDLIENEIQELGLNYMSDEDDEMED